jgi:PTH1 family peptidyl-tRNA hydrolase
MRMVVGLGNPGERFERTRLNAGYAVIDRLAMRWRVEVDRSMHQALLGTARRAGEPVLLAKPQTFMKASGDAVRGGRDRPGRGARAGHGTHQPTGGSAWRIAAMRHSF